MTWGCGVPKPIFNKATNPGVISSVARRADGWLWSEMKGTKSPCFIGGRAAMAMRQLTNILPRLINLLAGSNDPIAIVSPRWACSLLPDFVLSALIEALCGAVIDSYKYNTLT